MIADPHQFAPAEVTEDALPLMWHVLRRRWVEVVRRDLATAVCRDEGEEFVTSWFWLRDEP